MSDYRSRLAEHNKHRTIGCISLVIAGVIGFLMTIGGLMVGLGQYLAILVGVALFFPVYFGHLRLAGYDPKKASVRFLRSDSNDP